MLKNQTSNRLGSKNNPISADEHINDFHQVNHIRVTRNQHEQRLDNFLLSRLKGLPKSHLYKLIRADEVRINGKRCKAHDKLYRGDIIRLAPIKITTRERPVISQTFAQNLLERVVYEDEGLLVINKPSGIAVHGGSGESFGVIEAMREVTGKKYLELIHRIDKDTSGLLMISKKRSTLKKLQQYLRDKDIQKYYQCIVQGHVTITEQSINAPLLRYTLASGERRVKVDPNHEQSKPSQTDIKVIEHLEHHQEKISLVQAMPRTGRTHQIRVHMAHIGHPLLGDNKYHPKYASRNISKKDTEKPDLPEHKVRRLCLHAYQLDIPDYPSIIAPLPIDIAEILTSDLGLV